ncbi:MAG: hypothetical protein K6G28_02415 [Acholeplasmatales bacterium]|nr:hypothetical protein [Acholeplasmatales bacterium]
MIHGNFESDLIDLNKFITVLTVGDLNNRHSFIDDVIIDIEKKVVILKALDINEERITLSFLDKSYINNVLKLNKGYEDAKLTPIYDSDSFVSYLKESQFVYKLKNINKQVYQITQFLVREHED